MRTSAFPTLFLAKTEKNTDFFARNKAKAAVFRANAT